MLKLKKLELKNTKTGKVRIVNHYQLTDWPDGDIPCKKGKHSLNFLIDTFIQNRKQFQDPFFNQSSFLIFRHMKGKPGELFSQKREQSF